MPLSEHEQRLLDEMERSLYHEDGDTVASMGQRTGRPAYRAIVIGALVAVIGIAALLVGVIIQLTVVGVIGFIIMFAGVLLAIAPPRKRRSTSPHTPPTPARPARAGFMDRLEDRWDKRQHGG